MQTFDIIRAWKDARYRNSLSAEVLAALPEHPAGSIELDDGELNAVIGGLDEPAATKPHTTLCCSKKPATCEMDDGGDGGE